jgi:hypothetical protein
MSPLLLVVCLLGQTESDAARIDALRSQYQADAEQYELVHDAAHREPLALSDQPIMRWFNDNDWSGDVFVWSREGLPEAIGCVLSGPRDAEQRNVFHEFHILAPQPIAAVTLHSGRKWAPREGLDRQRVSGAPAPAETAAGRLSQMRRIIRDFSAHMQADGVWQLRLLPQPIHRYGSEKAGVIDGALFAYVWTRGTDPELVVMLECSRTSKGEAAWHWAPVRFSTRSVWMVRDDKEVWRSESHREPAGPTTDLPYTTSFARTLPLPIEPAAEADAPKLELRPKTLPE